MRSHMSFNPRPPGGGRLRAPCSASRADSCFNPRPPGGGRRSDAAARCRLLPMFQSTPPRRRATGRRMSPCAVMRRFNPRPPGGGRHARVRRRWSADGFQSTPPRRRATAVECLATWRASRFNPRPPGGGRRQQSADQHADHRCFNPRPPGGGRPGARSWQRNVDVSIHAPPEEGDRKMLYVTDPDILDMECPSVAATGIVLQLARISLVNVHFPCEPPVIPLLALGSHSESLKRPVVLSDQCWPLPPHDPLDRSSCLPNCRSANYPSRRQLAPSGDASTASTAQDRADTQTRSSGRADHSSDTPWQPCADVSGRRKSRC